MTLEKPPVRKQNRTALRAFLRRTVFSLAAIFLGLLLVEITLRVVRPENVVAVGRLAEMYATDEYGELSKMTPGLSFQFRMSDFQGPLYDFGVASDAFGHRCPMNGQSTSHLLPNDGSGERRVNVHCIGDSFTFGWGVEYEDSYPAQLQTMLGERYHIFNLGVVGTGLTTAVDRSTEIASQYPPSSIVYVFTEGEFSEDIATRDQRKDRSRYESILRELLCRVWLSRLPLSAVASFFLPRSQMDLFTTTDDPHPELQQELVDWAIQAADLVKVRDQATFDTLLALQENCRQHSVNLLVVTIYTGANSVEAIRFCRDHSIPMVNFMFARRQLHPDGHLNREGYAALAERIAQQIRAASPAE